MIFDWKQHRQSVIHFVCKKKRLIIQNWIKIKIKNSLKMKLSRRWTRRRRKRRRWKRRRRRRRWRCWGKKLPRSIPFLGMLSWNNLIFWIFNTTLNQKIQNKNFKIIIIYIILIIWIIHGIINYNISILIKNLKTIY